MFDALFPSHWSDIEKLMWLKILKGGSAVWDTISGNPVSFSAKAAPLRQLSVAFSPVQSLNGYDAPWPAGGGKNKFDPSAFTWKKWHLQSNVFETLLDSDPAISFTVNGSESVSITNTLSYYGIGVVVNAVDYDRTASLKESVGGAIQFWGAYEDGATRISTGSTSCLIPANTSGFLAIRKDNTEAKTAFVQVELGSSASAWTPYSNICPISGWSEVTVEQRGKNLFDFKAALDYWGCNYTDNGDGSFTVTSLGTGYSKPFAFSDKSITISASAIIENIQEGTGWGFDLLNGTSVVGIVREGLAPSTNKTANKIRLNLNSVGSGAKITNPMINLGSTASDYVPYNPLSRDIIIQLGDTYYGAQLDVLNGVLRVTHKMVALVGGASEMWGNYNATYGGYLLTLSDAKIDGRPIDQLKSNLFTSYHYRGAMAEWKPYYLVTYNSKTDSTMVFFTTSLTDKSEWLAWLAENPTQLAYPLETPIPIQLTPQEVQSLAGDNTMWSNANQPITVEYRSN